MPAKKKKVTAKKSKKTKVKNKVAKKKKVSTKKPKVKTTKKKPTSKSKSKSKVKTKIRAKKNVESKVKTKSKSKVKASSKVKKTVKPKKNVVKKVKVSKQKASPKKSTQPKKPKTVSAPAIETSMVAEISTEPPKATSAILGSLNFTPYHLSKDEEYMNVAQLRHFENILTLWKQQLMFEVDSTVVHMKEDVMSYPDPLDRASQEEGFNLELRTRDRERKLIKKIEQALDMIKKGEYGYCEDCGAEIGIRRLEARPTADKCIDCKTYEEIREKQIGGQ